MRLLKCTLYILLLVFLAATLYAQSSGQNQLLSYKKIYAERNPAYFIKLLGTSPFDLLKEYASLNDVEILPDDTEQSLRTRIIETVLNIKPSADVSILNESISRNNLNIQIGRVVLYHADIVEMYEIEDIDEEIIFLYGNVLLKLYDYTVSADKIIYSTKSDEVFGSGNVFLESTENTLEGQWFLLNRKSNVGIFYKGKSKFQSMTVEDQILKFKDNVFIGEKGSVTFSKLEPPAHSFSAQNIFVWDNKKIMTYNSAYRVGLQPVFWFPLFLQNYYGTGIITSFGESTREGLYIQNSKAFWLQNIHNTIRFDFYQKLGFLLGDEIRYNSPLTTLSLDAMFALGRNYYSLNAYESLYFYNRTGNYVNYFPPNASSGFTFRSRFEYDQSVVLQENEYSRTTVSGKLILASDPYFKSDYYNKRNEANTFQFLTTIFSDPENIGDQYAESLINNNIGIVNTGKNHHISAKADWNMNSLRNLSVSDNKKFDFEKYRTSEIILPQIEAWYSDTLGGEDSYYLHGLDIQYRVSGNYQYSIKYMPYEGLYFDNNKNINKEISEKLSERHNLVTLGDLSRAFTNTFMRFTPSISLGYNFQQSINPTPNDLIYDRNGTYTSLGNVMALSFFLPKELMNENVYDYFEPIFRFDSRYNIRYNVRNEYLESDTYGGFADNSISSALSVGGILYGIFFIQNLNLQAEGILGSGYDLRPKYDAFEKKYSLQYNTNRILDTYTGLKTRLSYKNQSYVDYDLKYDLVTTNYKINTLTTYLHIPISLKKLFGYIAAPLDKKGVYESSVKKIDLFFAYTYSHNFLVYLYNYMTFKAGIDLNISNLWRFQFSVSSRNNRAYRYIKSYSQKEKQAHVNIFTDIIDSFRFNDPLKRSESLFKLSSIEATLWHDLDGWEMLATFSIMPEAVPYYVASGSIKGYYWNKEFWIQFRLTEFNTIGFPKIDLSGDDALNTLIRN